MIKPGNKLPDGDMPQFEAIDLRHRGQPVRVRFDFQKHTTEGEEGDPPTTTWNFMYVTVPDLKEQTLQTAGVPQSIINQIIN